MTRYPSDQPQVRRVRRAERALLDGRPVRSYVPADATVRQHIDALHAAGLSTTRIAQAAGLDPWTIRQARSGVARTGRPRLLWWDTRQRILAVRAGLPEGQVGHEKRARFRSPPP